VGLGFGYRFGNNPYVDIDEVSSEKNDNSSDLVLLYLYEVKYLFSHGTSAGLHILKMHLPQNSLDYRRNSCSDLKKLYNSFFKFIKFTHLGFGERS